MNESERPTKVTLEDLLQLKRAERPSAEFWPEFEKELRAKQLAAIVQSRTSWRNWVNRKTLVRICMPLGAAAAVAMTFGSYRGVAPLTTPVKSTVDRALVVNTPVAEVKEVAVAASEKLETNLVAAVIPASVMAEVQTVSSDATSSRVMQVADVNHEASTNFSERTFSPHPVVQVLSEPTLMQMLGRAISVTSQAVAEQPRTPKEEPLAQVATPRDNRRSRLLAYSVTFDPHAADSSDAARSRERITHRLSDESIYDSITRLGLSGDRVSIKF